MLFRSFSRSLSSLLPESSLAADPVGLDGLGTTLTSGACKFGTHGRLGKAGGAGFGTHGAAISMELPHCAGGPAGGGFATQGAPTAPLDEPEAVANTTDAATLA